MQHRNRKGEPIYTGIFRNCKFWDADKCLKYGCIKEEMGRRCHTCLDFIKTVKR